MNTLQLAVLMLGSPPATAAEPLDDDALAAAIEVELAVDDVVSPDDITVTVVDGIATVDGLVRTWTAHERALEITALVRGVTAVVDDLDVRPEPRWDRVLRADVHEALERHPATADLELDVAVRDGRVTLSGTASSGAERSLAADIAGDRLGVRDVDNEITLLAAPSRSETDIFADVGGAIASDAALAGAPIDVTLEDDTVTLTGAVGSAWLADRAATLAWVPGVNTVDTEALTVEPWAHPPHQRPHPPAPGDAELAETIERALVLDPHVDPRGLQVEVEDGSATLRGEVATAGARDAAEATARDVLGVWGVDNALKVRSTDLRDPAVARAVRRSLDGDALLAPTELEVTVDDGHVTLGGMVPRSGLRDRARQRAAQVRGVRSVTNLIAVPWGPPGVPTWERGASALWFPSSDWEIQADVERHLRWSALVDATDVIVTSEDGLVTLEGTVDSWPAWRQASREAWHGGALAVDNDLQVDPSPAGSESTSDADVVEPDESDRIQPLYEDTPSEDPEEDP